MVAIGLTGGIGAGKSTVAEFYRRSGERIIDTDQIAREATQPGTAVLGEIEKEFGSEVIAETGELNRAALAEIVFGNVAQRRALERITHPVIRAAWAARVNELRALGVARCFVVIPLLFETHAQDELDWVIAVGCRAETQVRRLRDRGWSDRQISQRIQSQWPMEQKMDRAEHVVWNEGSLELCGEQAARILRA